MAKNEKSVTDLVCEHIKKQKLLPIPVQTLNGRPQGILGSSQDSRRKGNLR